MLEDCSEFGNFVITLIVKIRWYIYIAQVNIRFQHIKESDKNYDGQVRIGSQHMEESGNTYISGSYNIPTTGTITLQKHSKR